MEYVNKNNFMPLFLLIVAVFFIESSLSADFDYKDVDSWVQINQQCGGQRQSPVNLEDDQYDEEFTGNFSIFNADKIPLSAKLLNNGHTIKMQPTWNENETPYLAGGVFGQNIYVLDSIHFHWSRFYSNGSEHSLLGFSGALEMHCVHYNYEYGSVENALNYEDGLLVIGDIFEILSQRKRRGNKYDADAFVLASSSESPGLGRIINNLEMVSYPGSSGDIEPFAMSEFRPYPIDECSYFAYLGSLTTPPCTENVLWLLSTYPYKISADQLQILQSTVELNHDDDHNNRDVQPMNDRKFSIFWGHVEE